MRLRHWLPFSAVICSLMLLPLTGYSTDKGSSGEKKKKDKQSHTSSGTEDRGEPGKPGGEFASPGEGDQSGRPGTIFGGPATLPPDKDSPGYEGADKDRKGRERRQQRAAPDRASARNIGWAKRVRTGEYLDPGPDLASPTGLDTALTVPEGFSWSCQG